MSNRPFALAEEAGGPDDQHEDQQHEAVEVAVRGGDEHRAERLEYAQQEAADDAPRDGAEPADDDDLEALEGRDGAVLRVDEEVGRQERAEIGRASCRERV